MCAPIWQKNLYCIGSESFLSWLLFASQFVPFPLEFLNIFWLLNALCSRVQALQKWNNQQWGSDFWMCKTSFVVLWDKPGSVILDEGNVPLEYGYSQAVTLANSKSQPRGKMYSWKLLPLACTPEQIEKQIMPLWDLRFVQSSHESRAIHLHWP